MFNKTDHQKKEIEIIEKIEAQVKSNSVNFSMVEPVENYEVGSRMCC